MARWEKETDGDLNDVMGTIPLWGWALALVRGIFVASILLSGVVLTVILRLPEKLLFGAGRPVTPGITTLVCRAILVVIGLRFIFRGAVMKQGGAVVANHASWLDILVLNARKRIFFVSKSEVSAWPGIGFLARLTGTVFISRNARDAAVQTKTFNDRLSQGHRLLFFPEGTSTDGLRVLPFKSTLFQAFFAQELREKMAIQPVTVLYNAPAGKPDDFYGWWGDMDLGPHLLKVLSTPSRGTATVICHTPLHVRDFSGRKELAMACDKAVSSPFNQ